MESEKTVTVKVHQGLLEGEKLVTVTGDATYYSFKGIPYAAPPIGKLRFKAPQPPEPWNGIRKANQHGDVCTHIDIFTKELVIGSEDCLYLNVYSPTITPDLPLPVMFFIHGGGYQSGSGNDNNYGPDFLVEHNVILVTINYRLGPLGFLCMDTEEVPGNAGLKDQVAALKWVRNNIASFGGNPDNVTIFGQSAGGASCSLHVLSPLSKGLFQKAIAMSGVALNDFSIEYQPRRRAFALGKLLGLDTNDSAELLQFLQTIPVLQLIKENPIILACEEHVNNIVKMFNFVPVVEKDFGQSRFLTEAPEEYLTKGLINDVDLCFGYTNSEISLGVKIIESQLMNEYSRFPELFVPRKILYNATPTQILNLADYIKNHFFGSKPITLDLMPSFISYMNDTFVYDILRFARDISGKNKRRTYVYRFSGISERNVYGNVGVEYGIIGAAHLDDLMYLFQANQFNVPIDKSKASYKMIQQTCTLFTNFAKHADPTPDATLDVTWPQYDNESKRFLDIAEILIPGENPEKSTMEFWKSVHEKVGMKF